jgi:type III pantothenate kinase
VDFGTAVTFDIVSERRSYVGGVIAPGLEAMTNFLYQRTALLPRLSLKEPRHAVGKSTIEAMLSGAVFGYRGLVREILARIRVEQFPRKKVWIGATGGYARLIAGGFARDRRDSSPPHFGRFTDRGQISTVTEPAGDHRDGDASSEGR